MHPRGFPGDQCCDFVLGVEQVLAHLPKETQERPLACLGAFLGALRAPLATIEKQLAGQDVQLAVDVRQDGQLVGARLEQLCFHAQHQLRELVRPLCNADLAWPHHLVAPLGRRDQLFLGQDRPEHRDLFLAVRELGLESGALGAPMKEALLLFEQLAQRLEAQAVPLKVLVDGLNHLGKSTLLSILGQRFP